MDLLDDTPPYASLWSEPSDTTAPPSPILMDFDGEEGDKT
jgi:hypothetical protein